MKKLLPLLFLALSASAAPQLVKIGVNMHMTDTGQAGNGEELRTAMLMAADELNSRPNKPFEYKLVFEDNGYTPRGAVLAARKLISVNKVDMIYSIYDFAMAPVAPIAKQEKIANFGGSAWGVKYADGEYNFLFCSTEVAFAKELYKAARVKDIPTAIVGVRQASVPNFVEQMQKSRKADKLPDYEVVYFNPGEIEFRSILLKLEEKGIKRVVLLAFGNEMNKFLYQMRMNPSYKPELMGFSFGLPMAEDRKQVIGSIVAAGAISPKEFEEKFNKYKRLKEVKPEESVYAYDGLKLIAEALESSPPSNKPLRERILEALRAKKTFTGYTGSYTQEKGVFDSPARLAIITATGLEPYTP